MRAFKYISGIALIALLFVGCEKYIDFDASVTTPKLVANAWLNADSAVEVHVSRSLSVIDDGDLTGVTNASVNLLDGNGNVVEALTHDEDGYYFGTTIPNSGSWRVEVSAPDFTPISASDFVPTSVSLQSVDTTRITNIDGGEMEISFTIDDPAGEENYYLVRLRTREDWGGGEVGYLHHWMGSSDPVFENISNENWLTWGAFRDVLFDGQSREITITTNDFYFDTLYADTVEVVLYNVTEAGYNYRRSISLYNNADGNPFAQPVQVYSNVENGFGIFACVRQSLWPIEIQ